MTRALNRMISRFSVRTRIILLALIPVVGFLANGVVFITGENEVENAFKTVERATDLADSSRDFMTALITMRAGTHDFAARPSDDLIHRFERTHASAMQILPTLEATVDVDARKDIAPAKAALEDIAAQFDDLARNQKILGFTTTEGVRSRMTKAAAAVERMIYQDMSQLSDSDTQRLLVPLMTMRRYESEYRLTRLASLRSLFLDEYKNFQAMLSDTSANNSIKEGVAEEVKAYVDMFSEWTRIIDKVDPPVAAIDSSAKALMPIAVKIMHSTRSHTEAASQALAASQAHTRNIIAGVG
ncbi:MAG: hypothetical protein J0H89_14830, partial [Rhizobiales bacterium]|nr:hypothetical protein [Hyphomicrobiales bacterium]